MSYKFSKFTGQSQIPGFVLDDSVFWRIFRLLVERHPAAGALRLPPCRPYLPYCCEVQKMSLIWISFQVTARPLSSEATFSTTIVS